MGQGRGPNGEAPPELPLPHLLPAMPTTPAAAGQGHLPWRAAWTSGGAQFCLCTPIWQGGPHPPTLRMSTGTSPRAKQKWLLDYPPFGWIICTIASVHY